MLAKIAKSKKIQMVKRYRDKQGRSRVVSCQQVYASVIVFAKACNYTLYLVHVYQVSLAQAGNKQSLRNSQIYPWGFSLKETWPYICVNLFVSSVSASF